MKVVITGVSGQDGSLLAKKLIDEQYEVHGFVRRGSLPKTTRTDYLGISDKLEWHQVELTEISNVVFALGKIRPDIVFNLAAQSFVADSFLFPHLTNDVNYSGFLNILEAVRQLKLECSIYQASTSEMFGTTTSQNLTEMTPFDPRSPYAVSKTASYHIAKNYREAYGMRVSNGILFNHESELRGREFVTRKVTLQLNEIFAGKRDCLRLGNLNSTRDWGYAPDYVEAMRLIAFEESSDDYVVATNETHTVRELVTLAAAYVGFEIEFEGAGIDEAGYDKKTGRRIVIVDERYFRPSDVTFLKGDYTKINLSLGWRPRMSFSSMIERMVEVDRQRVSGEISEL